MLLTRFKHNYCFNFRRIKMLFVKSFLGMLIGQIRYPNQGQMICLLLSVRTDTNSHGLFTSNEVAFGDAVPRVTWPTRKHIALTTPGSNHDQRSTHHINMHQPSAPHQSSKVEHSASSQQGTTYPRTNDMLHCVSIRLGPATDDREIRGCLPVQMCHNRLTIFPQYTFEGNTFMIQVRSSHYIETPVWFLQPLYFHNI